MNTRYFIEHCDGISRFPVASSVETRKNCIELRHGFPSRVVANEHINCFGQLADQRAGNVAIGSRKALPDFVVRLSVLLLWLRWL